MGGVVVPDAGQPSAGRWLERASRRATEPCGCVSTADPCPGHSAGGLDWGLMELGRKRGWEAARQEMEELADLRRYDLWLFMGNCLGQQPSHFAASSVVTHGPTRRVALTRLWCRESRRDAGRSLPLLLGVPSVQSHREAQGRGLMRLLFLRAGALPAEAGDTRSTCG
jgi:hypothetical protein